MLNRYGPTLPLDLQTKGARPVSVVGKPKTPAPTFDGNLPRCNLETTACLPSGRPRQHHTPQPAPQSRKQFTRYDLYHTIPTVMPADTRQAVIQKGRKLRRPSVFKALVNPHTRQTTSSRPLYNKRERSVVIISVC